MLKGAAIWVGFVVVGYDSFERAEGCCGDEGKRTVSSFTWSPVLRDG
jgi:hypothetical protein